MKTQDWHVLPVDAGQIVERAWTPIGDRGAICRTYDRSDGSVRYSVHRWRKGGGFEPWNGCVGVWRRGRSLSLAEASDLLSVWGIEA